MTIILTHSNEFFRHHHQFYLLFSHRITNDARECEMEENMGQVNTMIGNVYSSIKIDIRKLEI